MNLSSEDEFRNVGAILRKHDRRIECLLLMRVPVSSDMGLPIDTEVWVAIDDSRTPGRVSIPEDVSRRVAEQIATIDEGSLS